MAQFKHKKCKMASKWPGLVRNMGTQNADLNNKMQHIATWNKKLNSTN